MIAPRTQWRPCPFGQKPKVLEARALRDPMRHLIQLCVQTGCNVRPKMYRGLNADELGRVRRKIAARIKFDGLKAVVGVRRCIDEDLPITIYRKAPHANGH